MPAPARAEAGPGSAVVPVGNGGIAGAVAHNVRGEHEGAKLPSRGRASGKDIRSRE